MHRWLVVIRYSDGLGELEVKAVDAEHALQRGLVSACLQYGDAIEAVSARRIR